MSDVIVDRYELRGTLGTGGMARVVDGYDRLLDRRVAVKLLRSDLRGDPAVRRRFVREAQAAASFAHPHAVAIYDTGQDDAVPYIVMELVEGPTLADVIAERGPLPVDEACTIACDVLDALAAAHRRGLVHRDIKPSNVLLEPADGGPGRAKLTDFGIAKGAREATAALTAMGQVMGTAAYLSPEQARGEDATARSDLYSMGVVCYEMLAGRPPFTGEHALVVVLAHRDQPPPRLDRLRQGLPRELTGVVHRSLEKDPARRFESAAAMREALRPFAGAGAGTSLPSALAAAATTAQLTDAADAATVPYDPHASTRAVGAPTDERTTASPAAPRRRGRRVWLAAAAFVVLALLAVAGVAALTGDRGVPGSGGPATGQPGPAVPEETAAPTEEPAAPEETSAPTEEPAPPTEETAAPTEETAAPTEETAAPTEETAAPTEETAAPTEETAPPTEEPAAPTEETAPPTEEPAAPEETAAPTEEPAPPTEETAAPTDSGS